MNPLSFWADFFLNNTSDKIYYIYHNLFFNDEVSSDFSICFHPQLY